MNECWKYACHFLDGKHWNEDVTSHNLLLHKQRKRVFGCTCGVGGDFRADICVPADRDMSDSAYQSTC